MLLRNKPPNRGLWNGVGGHIEPGEDPLHSVLREVAEETGYNLPTARFCGLLTWEGYEIPAVGSRAPRRFCGAVYLYRPCPGWRAAPDTRGHTGLETAELDFHFGRGASNIHYFGPLALGGAAPRCTISFTAMG